MVAGCKAGWDLEIEGGDEGRLEGWTMGETWAAGGIAREETKTDIQTIFCLFVFFYYYKF